MVATINFKDIVIWQVLWVSLVILQIETDAISTNLKYWRQMLGRRLSSINCLRKFGRKPSTLKSELVIWVGQGVPLNLASNMSRTLSNIESLPFVSTFKTSLTSPFRATNWISLSHFMATSRICWYDIITEVINFGFFGIVIIL